MRTLAYSKPHDLAGLHGELLASVPSLRPVANEQGRLVASMQLSGGVTDEVTLSVPSASNTAAIDAVVAAHNPAPYVAARQARKDADVVAGVTETTLRDRAETALPLLESAWTNWATLTPAQKDATLKLGVRVNAGLVRILLRKLDSAG